ncbi:MAG: CvpA family protein [Lachnospirales bacterium]
MNKVEIIIIVFILISSVLGYRKGLIGAIVDFFILIFSVISAYIFTPIFSKFYMGTEYYRSLIDKINNAMNNSLSKSTLELIAFFQEKLLLQDTAYIVSVVGEAIVYSLSFFLVIIIARLILGLIKGTLNMFADMPVVGGVNKVAGFLLGGLKAVLCIEIIFFILPIFITLFNLGNVYTLIKQSEILSYLYFNNIIFKILFKLKGL